MNTMGSVGTVYTIVSRMAEAQAGIEWKFFAKAKSGKKEDRKELGISDHPAPRLWEKPNTAMSGGEFRERADQHLSLVGETDWLVGRFGGGKTGDPMELWPTRPDRVIPIPDPDKWLSGYTYRSPDGQLIDLTPTQVIQVMLPNPWDPYCGLGPVQAALIDIESAKYSMEWNRNFFLNSAQPGGIIQVPEQLDDDRFNELTMRWAEQHKGVANAHRVAIIEGGAEWVDRGFNMRDMQFTELRDLSSEKIREAFGYPKPMLGGVDDVNRANAEAGEYVFAKWIVEQRAKRYRDVLNNKLLPLFGKDQSQKFEFDFESPVEPDAEREITALSAKMGALTQAVAAGFDNMEVAEFLDLPFTKWTKPEPVMSPNQKPGGDDEDNVGSTKKKDPAKKEDRP